MLATLPVGSIRPNLTQNQVTSLIRPPVLGSSSEGGQGPIKPIIDESTKEEEPATFEYPKETGELSDLIGVPEGIAGKAYYGDIITKNSNQQLPSSSYLFIDSGRHSTSHTNMPQFQEQDISLTRQSLIAEYSHNILFYSSYLATNNNSNYAIDEEYQSTQTQLSNAHSTENGFSYNLRIPAPQQQSYFSHQESVELHPIQGKEETYPLVSEINKTDLYKTDVAEYSNIEPVNLEIPSKDSLFQPTTYQLLEFSLPELHPTSQNENNIITQKETKEESRSIPITEYLNDTISRDDLVSEPAIKVQDETKQDISYKIGEQSSDIQDTSIKPQFEFTELKYSELISQVNQAQDYETPQNPIAKIDLPLQKTTSKAEEHHTTSHLELPELEQIQYRLEHNIEPNTNHQTTIAYFELPKLDFSFKGDINTPQRLGDDYSRLPSNIGFDDDIVKEHVEKRLSHQSYKPILNLESNISQDEQYTANTSPIDKESNQGVVYQPENRTYQRNIPEVRSTFANSEPTPHFGTTLDTLVSNNYNNFSFSLPQKIQAHTSYDDSSVYSNPLGISDIESEYDLELQNELEDEPSSEEYSLGGEIEELGDVVEEELKTKEQALPKENIESEAYDASNTESSAYEENESKEEGKAEEYTDSSMTDLALTASLVGIGAFAGLVGLASNLLKKESNEESNSNKPEELQYKPEKTTKSKNCSDSSECFAEIIGWLENTLKNPSLSEKEYKSLSECYAEPIKNIQKARKYIKERENGYSCKGDLYDIFHHVDFTPEQEEKFKLKDYIRDGEVQKGFKLAEKLIVEEIDEGKHTIEAMNTNTGEVVEYNLRNNTLYAYLDKNVEGSIVWKDFQFIDTETGRERQGVYWDEKYDELKSCLYLETIAEYHTEAKKLLGDKDKHGMKLNGIIVLINGEEPKNGTGSLWDYELHKGDTIEIVYKNDLARYDEPTQEAEIKPNYPQAEKDTGIKLESLLAA
ncbi:MAG: hypothetical protein U9O94_08990 [Nanoarchaeota archaeon]|nr:hypothetical protein [Nanoarchaeota archaeon]